jgi:HEPN domain-containing protein
MRVFEEYLEIAIHYLKEAYELLERGDPYDAAGKLWATVKHTTTALTTAVLKEAAPPKEASGGAS